MLGEHGETAVMIEVDVPYFSAFWLGSGSLRLEDDEVKAAYLSASASQLNMNEDEQRTFEAYLNKTCSPVHTHDTDKGESMETVNLTRHAGK